MANYSVDADLAPYESDLTWGLDGETTFAKQHTEAKRVLDDHLICNVGILEADLLLLSIRTLSNLKTISVLYVLYMLFNKHSNGPGDSFDQKAQNYYQQYRDNLKTLRVRIGEGEEEDDVYSSGGQIGLGG